MAPEPWHLTIEYTGPFKGVNYSFRLHSCRAISIVNLVSSRSAFVPPVSSGVSRASQFATGGVLSKTRQLYSTAYIILLEVMPHATTVSLRVAGVLSM